MPKGNILRKRFVVTAILLSTITLVACAATSGSTTALSLDHLLEVDLKQALIPADKLPPGIFQTTRGKICTNQTNHKWEQDTFECLSFRLLPEDCPCPTSEPRKETAPWLFPQPLKHLYGQIDGVDGIVGGLNIYLYESERDVVEAYGHELEHALEDTDSPLGRTRTPISDVGHTASLVQNRNHIDIRVVEMTDLVFTCCHTVVSMRLTHRSDQDVKDMIITYAKELDERLKQLVCQQEVGPTGTPPSNSMKSTTCRAAVQKSVLGSIAPW